MSFSSEIKEELSKLNNLKDKQAVYYELVGYLITKNTKVEKKVKFSTENEFNINRFNKLLNNMGIKYKIEMQGNFYVITFSKPENLINCSFKSNYVAFNKTDEMEDKDIRALLRGAFMGAGLVSEPSSTYHLEINFSNLENLLIIKDLMKKYNITAKTLNRNGSIALYIKEGEDISNFLACIGASGAMLKFEEIRVIKEARNNVNRMVNCEVANLNKTVNAATKQIEAIKKLKASKKFTNLSDELKEIAELRLKNPDASLIELGNMLKIPVGKSGVNYRLNKLIKIAEEI